MVDPTQYYLIIVQRMSTSDEADCISGWSGIVAKENLKNFGAIVESATLCDMALEGAPLTNIRPMTEEEIREYREAQDDD